MQYNTFSSLPAQHQRLVRLMQEIDFGRIENLQVRDGLPVFDPPPRAVTDLKFGAENGPHSQITNSEFALKQPVIELVAHMTRMGRGVVELLLIRHGVPFSMSVEVAVFTACQTLR
jgi:hypothetical protein